MECHSIYSLLYRQIISFQLNKYKYKLYIRSMIIIFCLHIIHKVIKQLCKPQTNQSIITQLTFYINFGAKQVIDVFLLLSMFKFIYIIKYSHIALLLMSSPAIVTVYILPKYFYSQTPNMASTDQYQSYCCKSRTFVECYCWTIYIIIICYIPIWRSVILRQ